MKLVWSPETASKAYIDTVKACEIFRESGVEELLSAMAAGWNAKFIVETWSQGGPIATSIGLAVASLHSSGRHACVVLDERSRSEYLRALNEAASASAAGIAPPEVLVGEPEEVMESLAGADFVVVDCKRKDFARVLRLAELSQRGAVLVCKNASSKNAAGFRWRSVVVDCGARRLVRSVFLPVGNGLDIAHVGATVGGGGTSGPEKGKGKWIKHVDQRSGEVHLIRK